MNTTDTAKPEAYILPDSRHLSPIPVTVVKRTQTTVTVKYLGRDIVSTFNVPKHGSTYYERGNKDRWHCRTLDFDVAKVEASIEAEKQRVALARRASDAIHALRKQLERNHNGMGHYCGNEADVEKLEAALAILTA